MMEDRDFEIVAHSNDKEPHKDIFWGIRDLCEHGSVLAGTDARNTDTVNEPLIEAALLAHVCSDETPGIFWEIKYGIVRRAPRSYSNTEPEPYSRLKCGSQDVNYDANKAGDA